MRLPAVLRLLLLLLCAPLNGYAACNDFACIGITSDLATVNSEDSELLNSVLGSMLGSNVSLSAADWQSLADANIGVDALSLDESLSLSEVYSEFADALAAEGNATAAAAANELATAVSGVTGTVMLGDVITVEDGSTLGINALDLTTAAASLQSEQSGQPPTTISVSAAAIGLDGSGADTIDLQAKVIETPVIYCGAESGSFRGGTTRIKLTVALTDGLLGSLALPGVEANLTELEFYAEVGGAQGTITAIDAVGQSVTATVEPQPVSLYLGQIDDGIFFSNTPIDYASYAAVVDFATIGQVTVTDILDNVTTVNIEARAAAYDSFAAESVTLSAPFPASETVEAGGGAVDGMVATLLSNLELRIDPEVLDPATTTAILGLVSTSLSPVLDTLVTEAVDPLLGMLGAGIGRATVTAYGVDAACSIAGYVYHDLEPDNLRDDGEDWSDGDNVFVQLRDLDNVVVRNTEVTVGSGAYLFDGIAPGSYVLSIGTAAEGAVQPPDGWLFINPQSGQASVNVDADSAETEFGLYHGVLLQGEVLRDDGKGGGTAYDAVRNGEETGIDGIAVQAEQAGSAVATTSTDADGFFSLYVSAANLPDSVRATTGSADTSVSEAGGAGSGAATDDSIELALLSGQTVDDLVFGDVALPALLQDQVQSGKAGGVTWFRHSIRSAAPGTITINANSGTAWPGRLYADDDCNGEPDGSASDTLLVSLPAGGSACLLLAVTVPAGVADAGQATFVLAGDYAFGATGILVTLENTDTLTASSSQLRLLKEVSQTVARPGETLTYTLRATNLGAEPVDQVAVTDRLPVYTAYVPGSATCVAVPETIDQCQVTAEPQAGSVDIGWEMSGSLLSGQEVVVQYQALVE